MSETPKSDPRVFFASERTLLGWVRTGIAIVGLGFVVSRFGLFLRLLPMQTGAVPPGPTGDHSHYIGVALVLLGALGIAVATVQHGRFIATLPVVDRPAEYSRFWALWLAGMLSLVSVMLALYLAFVPA
jgi:putative membrane protein